MEKKAAAEGLAITFDKVDTSDFEAVTAAAKRVADKFGKIDILIGTHKILGKGIEFKDLGLLVIDEEQKFGVAAKEKPAPAESRNRHADADRHADTAHAANVADRGQAAEYYRYAAG